MTAEINGQNSKTTIGEGENALVFLADNEKSRWNIVGLPKGKGITVNRGDVTNLHGIIQFIEGDRVLPAGNTVQLAEGQWLTTT